MTDQMTLARAVAEFSASLPPGSPRLWPCLIGPTGVGKTSTARAIAEATGRPLVPLLLGLMDPIDIAGVPERAGGVFRWARPSWTTTERALLFLDELDKARPEHWAAVLSMMTDLTVHGEPLGAGTAIIAAAQPDDLADLPSHETGRALCARLVWIPMTRQMEYLRDATGMALDWLPEPRVPSVPYLPEPADRQVHWLALFGRAHPELIESAAECVLGPKWAPLWLEDWRSRASRALDPAALTRAVRRRPEAIAGLEMPALIALAAHQGAVPDGDLKVWGQALEEIIARGTVEDAQAFLREFHASIVERWKARPEGAREIPLFGQTTPQEYGEELNRALRDGVTRLAQAMGVELPS